MKKEDILKLGVDEEVAKQIFAMHGADVTSLKAEINKKDEIINEQKEQMSSRDKDLSKLKRDNADNEELQKTISELQKQNNELSKAMEEKVAAVEKAAAIDLALLNDKALDTEIVKLALDMDKIELKDGELIGYREQIADLKNRPVSLFAEEKSEEGSKEKETPNPAGYTPAGGEATSRTYESFEEALKAGDIGTYYKEQKELGGNE